VSNEIEIGRGKRARRVYTFDEIGIVPTRRTRDPELVSTAWSIDAFQFEIPVLGAPMDSVMSPATAIALGKLGGLGVLNLEGLWTRYDDPQPVLDELARLGDDVDAVILELGANDALRGIDPAVTRRALDEILTRLKARNIPVLVAGMLAPPNLGHAYGEAFGRIFPELAGKHGALLYPFFLDGVAATAGLNLADGMHPNARGVDVIVERIVPKVEELLVSARARPRG